ncbi:MAG: hypothetical protein HY885_00280 [Deltaproteobacteria bacterium]|nr:hypothetical protein [Deltaproteobacteria bacterium]
MENTKESIAGIKTFLNRCRAEAQNISRDPVIRLWNSVEIEKYTSVLDDLGINHRELLKAANDYQKTAGAMLRAVITRENELENLEADLRLGTLSVKDTAAMTAKLQHDCRELQPLQATIRKYAAILFGTATAIQEKLSLHTLIPLARAEAAKSARHREMFEEGFKVYRLVTPDSNFLGQDVTIDDYRAKAEQLEAKFRKLELPRIPELGKIIIMYQIDTCLAVFKDIHSFLGSVTHSLRGEIKKIDAISAAIDELRSKPFSEILSSLPKEGKRLHKSINEFFYKSSYMKETENVALLLYNLKTLYEALRYSYLPHIAKATKEPKSRLNPQIIAFEHGHGYFKGLKGIIRRFKIAFLSTEASESLNEEILAQKIFIALTTCPDYYCCGNKEPARIPAFAFIDGIIGNFRKPYPYEDIFLLTKNAIDAYGSLIERDFSVFQTEPRPEIDGEENALSSIMAPEVILGRLMVKIESRIDHLRSLQPQN